jgi:copper chaperone CopZ
MEKTNIDNLNPEERQTETRKIGIAGMTCDKCVETVERALRGSKGVREVNVDRQSAMATVTFNSSETDLPALHDKILESGFKPAAIAA